MIDLSQFVDMGIIGAIVGIMQVLKGFDVNNKLVRFYPLFVLLLGIAAAFAKTMPWTWQGLINNMILYSGGASLAYKLGKTTVLGK